MNVLSPEIILVGEADRFHMREGSISNFVIGEKLNTSRGLSQRYDIELKRQELGRASLLMSHTSIHQVRVESKRQKSSAHSRQSDSFVVLKKFGNSDGAKGRMLQRSGLETYTKTQRGQMV